MSVSFMVEEHLIRAVEAAVVSVTSLDESSPLDNQVETMRELIGAMSACFAPRCVNYVDRPYLWC